MKTPKLGTPLVAILWESSQANPQHICAGWDWWLMCDMVLAYGFRIQMVKGAYGWPSATPGRGVHQRHSTDNHEDQDPKPNQKLDQSQVGSFVSSWWHRRGGSTIAPLSPFMARPLDRQGMPSGKRTPVLPGRPGAG
jgi:hypothetical protein